MSWLSNFLGLKKVKTPAVGSAEELASMDGFETDEYLKELTRKNGFTNQIKAGRKAPGGYLALGTKSYLGAV